jgi:hypothetical protein
MVRKLVKLDPNNGWNFTEVDPIALHRKALALKEYIESEVSSDDDEYDIRGQMLPLVNGALDGTMHFPIIYADLPLKYPSREGLLPREFERLRAFFNFTATGSSVEGTEEVVIDGERYGYMEFEEPGDWPDEVLRREDERRRSRMGVDYVPVSR